MEKRHSWVKDKTLCFSGFTSYIMCLHRRAETQCAHMTLLSHHTVCVCFMRLHFLRTAPTYSACQRSQFWLWCVALYSPSTLCSLPGGPLSFCSSLWDMERLKNRQLCRGVVSTANMKPLFSLTAEWTIFVKCTKGNGKQEDYGFHVSSLCLSVKSVAHSGDVLHILCEQISWKSPGPH